MSALRGRGEPGTGSIDSMPQRVVAGPNYATFWDLGRKLFELRQLTGVREQAVADYQAIVRRAWSTAFERLTRGLVGVDA